MKKIHDSEIESKEALKEAFLQNEPIRIGNIVYVPEHHTSSIASGWGVCQLCRFYRVKGICKSHIADKVCTSCGDADLDVNFNDDRWDISRPVIKLHYLQTIT